MIVISHNESDSESLTTNFCNSSRPMFHDRQSKEMQPTGASSNIPMATPVPSDGKWEDGAQFTSPVPHATYGEAMEELGGGLHVADCNRMVRMGFLRKVYGILSMQLLFTAIICAAILSHPGEEINGFRTLGWASGLANSRALYWCIFILSVVLLVALFCYKNSYPMNMGLLAAWTFSMALTVATACSVTMCDPLVSPEGKVAGAQPASQYFDRGFLVNGRIICAVGTASADEGIRSVVVAAFITMAIFVSLTVFTLQSKIDFSFLGVGLGVSLLVLIMWGFVMMIFGIGSMFLYAMAGTLIFSLYIIYDTWRLQNVYGPDDYIMAAIDLYLDVINLFIMLLQLFNSRE